MISVSICLISMDDDSDTTIWSGRLSHAPAVDHVMGIRDGQYSGEYQVLAVYWILYGIPEPDVESSVIVYVEHVSANPLSGVAKLLH